MQTIKMFIKKNGWLLFIVMIFLIGVVTITYDGIKKRQLDSIAASGTFNENIFSGGEINIESGTQKSSMNDFNSMKENGNYISFKFPNQPLAPIDASYEERSNILNGYLKDNNRYFSISSKATDGYFYIRTKNPTKDIFLYRHNSKISGKLRTQDSLQTFSEREFLFPLNNIPIKKFFGGKDYNYQRMNDINSLDTMFIGGYVVSFDGNKIEEIGITYK